MATWKKVIIFLLIVAVIGIVVFIGIKKIKEDDNVTDIERDETGQEITSEGDSDFINSMQDEVGTVQEDSDYEDIEVKGTDEEKAIALAKNEWRVANDTVSYNIVSNEGNIYYISVNDNATTEVLAWYKVNVKSGEVSEY